MARREFPTKVKVAAFQRSGGFCEGCGVKLTVGKHHFDHRIPDGLGGEPTIENCVVLCLSCHGAKTASEDVPRIAKAKRQEANHVGARQSARPLPGGRNSGWKHKIGGGWVRR
jgi:5-methylcytosine-specific restriction endonuclease McrA